MKKSIFMVAVLVISLVACAQIPRKVWPIILT